MTACASVFPSPYGMMGVALDDSARPAYVYVHMRRVATRKDLPMPAIDLNSIDLNSIDLTNLDLSAVDRFVVWYGTLPDSVRTGVSFVVGAVVAYLVFKIVAKILKGVLRAVIAAVLAFLLTTVPGNMILANAYDRIEQQVTTSLHQ